jgi:uncharacterized membrane-anchored protein
MTTAVRAPAHSLIMKVPEITVAFWVAKLLTTAFGEAFSDFVFFNDYLGQSLAIVLGLVLLLVCVGVQLRARSYHAVTYWVAATAVSVFGTMSADFVNKDLGVPLWGSTLALLVLQGLVFVLWYRARGTLDVHSVTRGRPELYYWLTVVLTFALGTAAGDFVADTLGLGSLASAAVFLVIIAVPALAYRVLSASEVVCFWVAYSVTRPLGASVSDWLAVPAPYGDGLQLGTGVVSVAALVPLVLVVAYLARRQRSRAGEVAVA